VQAGRLGARGIGHGAVILAKRACKACSSAGVVPDQK
jgi:hypothetical protein